MTYEEFIERCKSVVEINDCGPYEHARETFYPPHKGDKRRAYFSDCCSSTPRFDFVAQWWQTGGVSGGSCWESSDPRPYSTGDLHRPATFEQLDKILESICPSITFLQYRSIESLIKTKEIIDYEYYGNRTDFQYRYINLKELYNSLSSKNLI